MKRESLQKLPMIVMILVGALLLAGCTEQSPQPLPPEVTEGVTSDTNPANEPAQSRVVESENVREFKAGEVDPEVIPDALEVSPD